MFDAGNLPHEFGRGAGATEFHQDKPPRNTIKPLSYPAALVGFFWLSHGTLVGHSEAKKGNKSPSIQTSETAHDVVFIAFVCCGLLPFLA